MGETWGKRRIQLQAVREIQDKYTWQKVMKKYCELYRKAKRKQIDALCNGEF